MPSTLVDILRLGFPGLAAYFLYLAFNLSKQVVDLPDSQLVNPLAVAEKRKTVNFYGFLCVLTLVLSIGAEISKVLIKPPVPLVKTFVVTSGSDEELRARDIELWAYVKSDGDKPFEKKKLSSLQPCSIDIPSADGMILFSVPPASEIPN